MNVYLPHVSRKKEQQQFTQFCAVHVFAYVVTSQFFPNASEDNREKQQLAKLHYASKITTRVNNRW